LKKRKRKEKKRGKKKGEKKKKKKWVIMLFGVSKHKSPAWLVCLNVLPHIAFSAPEIYFSKVSAAFSGFVNPV
jgi:hypothetical protein